MRKYAFRIFIIALFFILLVDINQNPETNYTTKLESTTTGNIIDLSEEIDKASDAMEEAKSYLQTILEEILKLIGWDSGEEGP